MFKILSVSMLSAITLSIGGAEAQTCSSSAWPHTFINGTPADANQVMDNFNCAAPIINPHFTGGVGVTGATLINSGITNSSARPTVGIARISGEIGGYSSSGLGADDGFLRLSAGGGTTAAAKSYIDISGYSTTTDMAENIVFGTQATERMRIAPSGNVGIGTKSPGYPLEVNGVIVSKSAYGAIIAQTSNTSNEADVAAIAPLGNTAQFYGSNATGTVFFGQGNSQAFISTGTNQPIAIGTNGVERMRVGANGNVGIGTTTPSNLLSVHGPSTYSSETGQFQISDTATAMVLNVGVGTDGSNYVTWMQSVRAGVANQNLALEPYGGNVGIGTTTPAYQLTVAGTAYAGGAAGALSDIRHKKDIASLEDGVLDSIMKLRPVSFQWKAPKDDGMRGRQMGFIAQEVEKVLPSAVLTQHDTDKTKGLKYNEIVAVLTKAIQEQQAQFINALDEKEAEIKNLKAEQQAQIDSLQSEITALKSSKIAFLK